MKNKVKITITLSSILLLLTSCNTDTIEERISKVVNDMLPNLWLTLIQLAIFILVAILFIIFAYKPLKKKLNKRSEYIENNIKESEEKNKEADENLLKSQKIIEVSEEKAGEIIQSAQKTAELKASDVENELAKSIEQQKLQAHKDIEAERIKMIKEAKETIIDTAISSSKEILKREFNKDDNDKLLDSFLNELSEENK